MKRSIVIGFLVLLAISCLVPAPAQAWRGHHGGWHSAGWFAGGLAFGTLLGVAVSRPYYYPAPVYAYPPPVYVYPAPVYAPAYVSTEPSRVYTPEPANRAYAYPDPAYTTRPAPQAGEWVTVPGQSINGKWVPEHRAWVPKQ